MSLIFLLLVLFYILLFIYNEILTKDIIDERDDN